MSQVNNDYSYEILTPCPYNPMSQVNSDYSSLPSPRGGFNVDIIRALLVCIQIYSIRALHHHACAAIIRGAGVYQSYQAVLSSSPIKQILDYRAML